MSDKKSLPSGWGKQTSVTSVWANKEGKKQEDKSIVDGKTIIDRDNNTQSKTVNTIVVENMIQNENQSSIKAKEEIEDDLDVKDLENVEDIEVVGKNYLEEDRVRIEEAEDTYKNITDNKKELVGVERPKGEVKNKKIIIISAIVVVTIILMCVIYFVINGMDSTDNNSNNNSTSDNGTEDVGNLSNSLDETTVENESYKEEQTTETNTITEADTTTEIDTTTEVETTTEIETTGETVVNSINPDDYFETLWSSEDIQREIYIYYVSNDSIWFNLCYAFNGVPVMDNISAKLDGNTASFVWAYQLDIVRGNIVLDDDSIILDITESSLDEVPVSKEIYYYEEKNNYEEETTPPNTEQSTTHYEEETTTQSEESNSVSNITYESIVDWSAYVGKWSSEKVAHTHGEKKCYDVVLSLDLYEEDNSIYYKLDMCNGNALYNTSRGWLYSDGDGTYSGRDNMQINIVELGVYNGGVHLLVTNTYNIFDYGDAFFDLKIE